MKIVIVPEQGSLMEGVDREGKRVLLQSASIEPQFVRPTAPARVAVATSTTNRGVEISQLLLNVSGKTGKLSTAKQVDPPAVTAAIDAE